MSDTREMNAFLRNAAKPEVDSVLSEIILTERQEKVFGLYFIKRKDVSFIADTLCISPRVICREIHEVRCKFLAVVKNRPL